MHGAIAESNAGAVAEAIRRNYDRALLSIAEGLSSALRVDWRFAVAKPPYDYVAV